MKSMLTKAMAVGALSVASCFATAGLKVDMDVGIGDSYIRGAVGSVYNSQSASEYIFIVDSGNSVTVTAANGEGSYKNCVALDANHIQTLRSISDESYIYASFNEDGVCTSVTLYNGSLFTPKAN